MVSISLIAEAPQTLTRQISVGYLTFFTACRLGKEECDAAADSEI